MNTTAADAIRWFKVQFSTSVSKAFQGTPFSTDMAAAIAMQETFSDCWGRVYQTMPVGTVLQLCVGDTLDYPKRGASAFPKDKANLCQTAAGEEMFGIARQALEDIAKYNNDYAAAARNPDKFCHGFGIFQYDIQHFEEASGRDFFLKQGWYDFDQCAAKLTEELKQALVTAYGSHKTSLNDGEMMYVAIAYNSGHVRVGGGPKQGYQDDDGKYYGENFQTYLALAHSISSAGPLIAAIAAPPPSAPMLPAGQAPLPALAQHALAIMEVQQRSGSVPSNAAQPTALEKQVDQFCDLMTALAGGASARQLGPVNGALGQTIGRMLDGKKSAIGIVGSMVTAVLQAAGSELTTTVPVVGSFKELGQAALPIFLATAAWGVLGKMEKWSPP
ncbi:hypothetical protein [Bradyrhizobium genosp. P]|uniref:hypothetical protein n=1 Tax=Bradyrhizobium genosp. P TaxID=83641 RepID=UPI003CEADCC3